MSAQIIPFESKKSKVEYLEVEGYPYLRLRSDTGIYYVRKYKKGKGELFKSTGETKKMRAVTVADAMIADWLGNRKATKRKRIEEVCTELLPLLEKDLGNQDRRRRTFAKDRTYMKTLTILFGEVFVDEIDEAFWQDWVRHTGKGLNRNLFDIAKYLSKVMTYAVSRKYALRKPRFHNPDKRKARPFIYENDLILEFLEHADPLCRDMILLPAENPLRAIEATELRWDFVTFNKDGSVVIALPPWFTKMEKERSFLVSPNGSEVLRRRYAGREGPYVFPSIKDPTKPLSDCQRSRVWRRMLARLNEKRIQDGRQPLGQGLEFRHLRHSFYTKALLDAKIDIVQVSEAGGTSVPTLQKHYLNADVKRLAAVSTAVNLDLARCHEFVTNDSGKTSETRGKRGKSRDQQGRPEKGPK